MEELDNFLNNPHIKFDPIALSNVTSSPVDNNEYRIIEKALKSLDENTEVIPYLFPAGTDNKFFRKPSILGLNIASIPSYGVMPIKLNAELVKSMHGSNERFPIREIGPGIKKYFTILKNLVEVP